MWKFFTIQTLNRGVYHPFAFWLLTHFRYVNFIVALVESVLTPSTWSTENSSNAKVLTCKEKRQIISDRLKPFGGPKGGLPGMHSSCYHFFFIQLAEIIGLYPYHWGYPLHSVWKILDPTLLEKRSYFLRMRYYNFIWFVTVLLHTRNWCRRVWENWSSVSDATNLP